MPLSTFHKETMRKVAIVGFSANTRNLVPYNNPDFELWTMNNFYKVKDLAEATNISRVIDVHNTWEFYRDNDRYDDEHLDWMRQEHPYTIYLWNPSPTFPSAKHYPLEVYMEAFPDAIYTSSIDYLMAMAIYEGVDEIWPIGIEMAHGSEYFHQRFGFYYWIGLARGRGIKVTLPRDTSILREDLYGLEDAVIAHHTFLVDRLKELTKQQHDAQLEQATLAGQLKELNDLVTEAHQNGKPHEIVQWLYDRLNVRAEELGKADEQLSFLGGSIYEAENSINWREAQNKSVGRLTAPTPTPEDTNGTKSEITQPQS